MLPYTESNHWPILLLTLMGHRSSSLGCQAGGSPSPIRRCWELNLGPFACKRHTLPLNHRELLLPTSSQKSTIPIQPCSGAPTFQQSYLWVTGNSRKDKRMRHFSSSINFTCASLVEKERPHTVKFSVGTKQCINLPLLPLLWGQK